MLFGIGIYIVYFMNLIPMDLALVPSSTSSTTQQLVELQRSPIEPMLWSCKSTTTFFPALSVTWGMINLIELHAL